MAWSNDPTTLVARLAGGSARGEEALPRLPSLSSESAMAAGVHPGSIAGRLEDDMPG